ncbi:MAG: hypothetical protein EOP11_17220 [Proteobacteria bacterium]|nr:MAG: hypothetical protein EOP11_17220 [Pseudomonadota bacterium]
MIPSNCLKCSPGEVSSAACSKFVKHGFYNRSSDGKRIQRYRCTGCGKSPSIATFDHCFRQKKRHMNERVVELLCSGVSLRRVAMLTKLNRKTVVRIFLIESMRAEFAYRTANLDMAKSDTIEFDDMETFEHTKCKPLSITLAVEQGSRRILGVEVSAMAANGKLAKKARRIYGPRKDERRAARKRLFARIESSVKPGAKIKSDQNPHYRSDVAKAFPGCTHERHKGKRGSLGGQGEIKKVKFDPLFSLNHTCAMFRANINRLFRKTWCTTKKAERLYAHIMLYVDFHNSKLIAPLRPVN